MNIMTRFKWPVIIAAGLHGALFVSIPGTHVPYVREKPENPPVLRPIPKELEVQIPDENDPAGAASGGVDPLPSIPDTPQPPAIDTAFEMPVTNRSVPDMPAIDLKDHRLDGGIGPGTGMGVSLPSISAIDKLDRVPRAMAQPAPVYPHAMRQDGVTGDVTVEFIVGTDGSVISAQAMRWSRREFVDPAVNAVLKWRFEPGTVNGRKVRFRMAIPIEFYATK